ncbi:MAG: glycosyltransferase [Imperialibacter sp.]|uniref:glycosyltransferase n=1 Tax=Imperialibacter sp. TaxID=2038411 RepID=UPI0032EAC1DE
MGYPKVLLLLDEIPQSVNAGCIQFYRLFKNWPAEQLLVIGRAPSDKADKLRCVYHTLTYPFFDRWRLTRFSKQLSDAEALGLIDYKLPRRLAVIADQFQPDVVVTLMQLFMYYRPAYHYAKSRKLPLVVFCHDDAEDFSRVSPSLLKRMVSKNTEVYQFAKKRICISPEMAKAWEVKYGLEGDFLYPVASESIQPRAMEENLVPREDGFLTFGFAGSLAYGYLEGISELMPFLVESRVKIRIYRDPDDRMPAHQQIEFCGYAPTPEATWERIKRECDAVLLPYSFQERFKSVYSTHFPSKLPEYLRLGMPVVVRGPEYATGVSWSMRNPGTVLASNSNSKVSWLELIAHLFSSAIREKLIFHDSVGEQFSLAEAKAELSNHLHSLVKSSS